MRLACRRVVDGAVALSVTVGVARGVQCAPQFSRGGIKRYVAVDNMCPYTMFQLSHAVAVVRKRRGGLMMWVPASLSAGGVRDRIPPLSLSAGASASAQRFGIGNQPVSVQLRRSGWSVVVLCVLGQTFRLATLGNVWLLLYICAGAG